MTDPTEDFRDVDSGHLAECLHVVGEVCNVPAEEILGGARGGEHWLGIRVLYVCMIDVYGASVRRLAALTQRDRRTIRKVVDRARLRDLREIALVTERLAQMRRAA